MQNDKSKFKIEFRGRVVAFTVEILRLAEILYAKKVMIPVAHQVIRSAGSIGANIIEARAASSKKDYIKFFEIALKSANETQYWLEVIQKFDPAALPPSSMIAKEADELTRMISASVLTLKGRK